MSNIEQLIGLLIYNYNIEEIKCLIRKCKDLDLVDYDEFINRIAENPIVAQIQNFIQQGTKVNIYIINTDLQEIGSKLNFHNIYGETALHLAIKGGFNEIVTFLLQQGANVNIGNSYAKTPLHYAVAHNSLKIISKLKKYGADFNQPDKYGCTPLNLAIMTNMSNVAHALVDHGADVLKNNNNEVSPLHYAATAGDLDIVKLLVSKGAELNSKTKVGTPIDFAAGRGHLHIVQYFVNNKGVEPTPLTLDRAACSGQLEIVKYLLAEVVDHNMVYKDWPGTILHSSVMHIDVLKYSVENILKIDIDARDWNNNTALHLTSFVKQSEAAKYLLNQGANLEATNNEGNTPLHNAANQGNYEVVKLLINQGANLEAQNKNKEIPAELALNCLQKKVKQFVEYFNENNFEELDKPDWCEHIKSYVETVALLNSIKIIVPKLQIEKLTEIKALIPENKYLETKKLLNNVLDTISNGYDTQNHDLSPIEINTMTNITENADDIYVSGAVQDNATA